MQPKISLKRALLISTLWGVVLFAAFPLYITPQSSAYGGLAFIVEDAAASTNQEQARVGLPVRLKIPVINVDSAIIPVGFTFDGAMDAPKDPAEAAWFNLGPRPGEQGSAVIAGHYGWENNMPAAFDKLHTLRKGDIISTEDEEGVITAFIVREIRTYNKDDIAPDVFGSDDGNAHLNLITCAGTWNQTEQTRSERLVVFADKE